MTELLYDVTGLRRVHGRGRRAVTALDGVDLQVYAGQRLGIVGESGSGKSTLVRLMDALDMPSAGSVTFRGRRILGVPERRLGFLRSSVQMVFQDPRGSLDPRMTVRRIVSEPLRAPAVRGERGRLDQDARVMEVLAAVGLDASDASRYPHEFSGGQRQRIAIARALAPFPDVLIADEPLSALDVSVRAQVLNLLSQLVSTLGLTLVFVSHDLAVVRHLCDTVVVMQQGRIVESGPTQAVLTTPVSPYTRSLVASAPRVRLD